MDHGQAHDEAARAELAQTVDELLAARPIDDLDNGLWHRIHTAVTAESGADKSLWNGRLNATDLPVAGFAAADGSLTFNDYLVVWPLQQMYERRGQSATPAEWAERRRAFKSVAHEFSHLTAPEAHQLADRQRGVDRRELKPIEEGITEAWSVSRLDRLVDRVFPPDLAEGLKSVSCPESYPAWTPAARSFVDEVGSQVGLPGDEVLQQLNQQAQVGKAGAAAELLFERSALPRLVPAAEHAAVKERIRASVDDGFAALVPLKKDASVDRAAISGRRGAAIAAAAITMVHEVERQYRNPSGPAVTDERGRPADHAAIGGEAELASLRAVLAPQVPATAAPQQRPGQAPLGRGRPALAGPGPDKESRTADR